VRVRWSAATLPSMNAWVQLFRIAVRQFGVVTRAQAVGLGIGHSTFTLRVRREQWAELHPGVYVVPGTRITWLTRVSAALLAVGERGMVTGDTALHLHGVTQDAPARLTIVVPHADRAPRVRGAQVVRSRTLVEADRTAVQHLACATPARALLDAAAAHDHSALRVMLIDARQRRVVEPATVIARIAQLSWRAPGRNRLLRAAFDIDAVGADSVLTHEVQRRLVASGLRPDAHPVAVDVGRGRRLHPDITFAESFVCIECDSLAHHGSQRAIDLDHRKEQAYSEARWRCLRIGWRRMDYDWGGFVTVVRHALDEWPKVVAALGR
jgi:hypothetical protein